MTFAGSGLIREVTFGGSGLWWKWPYKRVAFGGGGLIRGWPLVGVAL